MAAISFPDLTVVQKLLSDQVEQYAGYEGLRMVVGCVAPSTDGGTYLSQIYPVDLSSGGGSTGSSVDASTPFLLGSTSKTFTAVAYTLLCANYIGYPPNTNPSGNNIDLTSTDLTSVFTSFPALSGRTFGDVVTYTAALLRYNKQAPKKGSYPPEAFISDLQSSDASNFIDPTVQCGKYEYSNLGFALLGLLMDQKFGVLDPAIGTDLASVMQSTVFGPLNLKSTGFFPPGRNGGGVPAGYAFENNAFASVDVVNPDFPAYYTGGGIMTNGTDLAHWLAFNMGLVTGCTAGWDPSGMDLSCCLPTVCNPVASAPTKAGGSSYPCSGWFATLDGNAPVSFWKDGSLSGTSSYLVFNPGPNFKPGGPNGTPGQAGVFVMLNCSEFKLPSGRSMPAYIAESVLGLMQS